MPRLKKPESAIDRLAFLKKAHETGVADTERGTPLLSAASLTQAGALIPKLEEGIGAMSGIKSASQKEVREKNQAFELLKTHVRDTWEVIRRRIYRQNLPVEVFAYYQLPQSGLNPELGAIGQWMETAALIIKGDADAVAAGYAAMSNPSAAETDAALQSLRKEAADVSTADMELDAAQEKVSDLMPETASLIDHMIAELNFNLYDKDDASRRRIMRTYGVVYEYAVNETPDEEITSPDVSE